MLEQITEFPAPHIVEERVQNRALEQTTEFPVPHILEAAVDVVPSTPHGRVQNCTQEQILDFPVPRIMKAVKFCLQHHKIVCTIVLGNSSLMCQCPTSKRNLLGRSSALEKCSLCLIIVMTRLAHWILWVSASRVWTSLTCLGLEMLWCQRPRSLRASWAMWSKWFLGSIGNLRLLRTSLCTVSRQSARALAAAPSSNVELLRFQQIGVGPVLGPGC